MDPKEKSKKIKKLPEMNHSCSQSDNKLLRYLICNSKEIKIYDSDDEIAVILKTMINDVVSKDIISKEYCSFIKYTCINHSAFKEKGALLNKMNQIRQKNWYFKPLKM